MDLIKKKRPPPVPQRTYTHTARRWSDQSAQSGTVVQDLPHKYILWEMGNSLINKLISHLLILQKSQRGKLIERNSWASPDRWDAVIAEHDMGVAILDNYEYFLALSPIETDPQRKKLYCWLLTQSESVYSKVKDVKTSKPMVCRVTVVADSEKLDSENVKEPQLHGIDREIFNSQIIRIDKGTTSELKPMDGDVVKK